MRGETSRKEKEISSILIYRREWILSSQIFLSWVLIVFLLLLSLVVGGCKIYSKM